MHESTPGRVGRVHANFNLYRLWSARRIDTLCYLTSIRRGGKKSHCLVSAKTHCNAGDFNRPNSEFSRRILEAWFARKHAARRVHAYSNLSRVQARKARHALCHFAGIRRGTKKVNLPLHLQRCAGDAGGLVCALLRYYRRILEAWLQESRVGDVSHILQPLAAVFAQSTAHIMPIRWH